MCGGAESQIGWSAADSGVGPARTIVIGAGIVEEIEVKAEYIIGADIVEEIEVKVGYMGVLADRILYSNRSRYSRGDRGEGGIHGCLGGQDLEVPMSV